MTLGSLTSTFYATRERVIAGTLAAAMAVMPMAVAPGDAQAEDSRYSASGWTQELIAFDKASRAARSYAETKDGIAILIHVGKDIPNQYVKSADQLGALFVQRFVDLGENARYFVAPNDARATGITYHVGHLIVGAHNGTEVRDLQEAWDTAPDAIAQLKALRSVAELSGPSAAPGGS